MTSTTRVLRGRCGLMVEAPPSWDQGNEARRGRGCDGEAEGCRCGGLTLVGPAGRRGRRAQVRIVRTSLSAEEAELSAEALAQTALCERLPGLLVTSTDVWPHPVWGDGALVQGARVDGSTSTAHDCYVFSDGSQAVRIEVDCPLADLLLIEEELAQIVARVRPEVA